MILEWAARAGYVVVTHDRSTMTRFAYERLRNGLPMPGLVIVPQTIAIGQAVRGVVELLRGAKRADLAGRVIYL